MFAFFGERYYESFFLNPSSSRSSADFLKEPTFLEYIISPLNLALVISSMGFQALTYILLAIDRV